MKNLILLFYYLFRSIKILTVSSNVFSNKSVLKSIGIYITNYFFFDVFIKNNYKFTIFYEYGNTKKLEYKEYE